VSHPPQPSQRNWFRKSQLMSLLAIGLQKPYAKMKVSRQVLHLSDILTRWMVIDNEIKIPGINFQDQNNEQ
jgi:hypothetical protein